MFVITDASNFRVELVLDALPPSPIPAGYNIYEVADDLVVEVGDLFDGVSVTETAQLRLKLTRAELKAKAVVAVSNNIAYINGPQALADATAQVEALTRQNTAIIRLLLNELDSIEGT